VEPSNVTLTLGPGGSADVNKVVHTPPVPPKPDLVFIADTTGSMGGAIANVRTNAADILNEVSTAQPTAQFAVAEYKDFTDTSHAEPGTEFDLKDTNVVGRFDRASGYNHEV
jgi:hypothetical protein